MQRRSNSSERRRVRHDVDERQDDARRGGGAGRLAGRVLLGLWLGARGEQSTLVELITRTELTPECRKQLDRGIKAIIEDWEGPPAQSE